MKNNRSIRAFATVFLGVLLFVLGFSYIKSGGGFGFSSVYYAVYENVNGLSRNASVDLNGYKVGVVKEIEFLPNGKLLVTFTIDEDVKLSKKTIAHLADDGIIGSKAIQVIPVEPDGSPLMPNDTLNTTVASGLREMISQQLDPFVDNINRTIQGVDSLFDGVNHVIDTQGQKYLMGTMKELYEMSVNLRKFSVSANELMNDHNLTISKSLSNTERVSENLKEFTDKMKAGDIDLIMSNLKSTSTKLDVILSKLEKSDGTMGKFINDPQLYENMKNATREVQELARDMKLHPKRYFSVLKRKETPYVKEASE